jgi:urease accessory protein
MTDRLFPLLQLCDSNFPTGSFSHTFGIETYIQEGKVHNSETFKQLLNVYILKSLTYSDGLACRIAYQLLVEQKVEEIWELDEILFASSSAKESREASRRVGQQMARLCLTLYPTDSLSTYYKKIKEKQCYGHPALVFALVCHGLTISRDLAVTSCLYASVSSLIQNAVRGIPLGQTDGQALLLWAHGVIQKAVAIINELPKDELGRTLPGLEIAQMRHEQLHVRLFMS